MTEAERIKITDSLTQFGGTLTMAQAASAFGVPRGSVCRWAKERNDGKVVPLKVALPPAPEPSRASKAGAATVKVALERDRILAEGLGEQLRGDYRETFTNLLTLAKTRTRIALEGPPVGEDGAVLADWTPPDMREVKAITEAIAKLVEHGSAILAMDKNTQAPTDRDVLTDAAEVSRELRLRRRG